MFGVATPYVVAFCSILFCAASALALFNMVEHFDPPQTESVPTMAGPIAEPLLTDRVAV